MSTEKIADPYDGIRERLVKIRGKRSQRQFARDVGVYQQNVNRYESGGTVPHLDFLLAVARAEGVDLHWFLTGRWLRRRASGRRKRASAARGPAPR